MLCFWFSHGATHPLQRPVTSARRRSSGLQTAAASRRKPSSQGGTGTPQSSDNERNNGRLQTHTQEVGCGEGTVVGGEGGWITKHAAQPSMLALRQSHIMTIQSFSHSLPPSFLAPAFADNKCLKPAAISENQVQLESLWHCIASGCSEKMASFLDISIEMDKSRSAP